jgi:hypothetical protein
MENVTAKQFPFHRNLQKCFKRPGDAGIKKINKAAGLPGGLAPPFA